MKTVLVTKTTKVNEKNGSSKLVSAKNKVYKIEVMYSPTSVKTTSGDVWEVKPYDQKVKDGNKSFNVDYIAVQ